MSQCVQCNGHADLTIQWLAKKSPAENEPQKADICSECMALLWDKHKHTQFGQTVCIEGVESEGIV